MNKALIIPLTLAILAMLVKNLNGIYTTDINQPEHVVILTHVLFILLGIFYCIWQVKTEKSFSTFFKAGLKATGVYMVVYCTFLWFYYTSINPDYFTNKVGAQVTAFLTESAFDEGEIKESYFALSDGKSIKEVASSLSENPLRDSLAKQNFNKLFKGEPFVTEQTKESFPTLVKATKNKLESFFSVKNYISVTVMCFLLIGMVYSLLTALIFNNLLSKLLKNNA